MSQGQTQIPFKIEYRFTNHPINESALNRYCRLIYPKIQEFYMDVENVRKFEEWKKTRQKENGREKTCSLGMGRRPTTRE